MRDSIRIERGEAPFDDDRFRVYLESQDGEIELGHERELGYFDLGFDVDAYDEIVTSEPHIDTHRVAKSGDILTTRKCATVSEALEHILTGTRYENLLDMRAMLA